MSKRIGLALASVVAATALASSGRAATISNVTILDQSSFTESADNNDFYVNTGVAPTISCGALCTSFEIQFAGNAGVEVDLFENETINFTWSYQTTFDVNAAPTEQWQVTIATRLLGALTLVSDGAGSAAATLNDVVGTYSGPGIGTGSLDLVGLGSLTGGAGGNTAANAGDRVASFVVASAGPATLTLTFTMTGSVTSTCGGFFCLAGGDEAAARLGASPGGLGGFSAGSYPGAGGRTQANDGHFLNVLIANVPEPSAALLVAASLLALALLARVPRARPARAGRSAPRR